MNAKDIRSLSEAYMEVYAPQEDELKEDFELWVNGLVEEGYDLSDYTWDEMYKFYLDEAITSEKGKAKAAQMIAARTTASGRAKPGQGANVATIKHIGRSNRDGLLGTPPNRKVAGSNWPKSYSGIGGTGNKAARRAAALNKEQVDIYDIILSHLLGEGYAETPEAAEAIMVNMSEEWRDSIMLDEGVTLAQYKRKRQEYKDSQSGRRSSRVNLGPAGSEARVERDMETRGAFGTGEYGGTTKNPKKLRKQKAMGEH